MQAVIDNTFANGVPHLEEIAQAVAALTEHASTVAATYDRLVRSKYNVRTKKTDVTELKALIRAHGLLQNLVGYRQVVDGIETGVLEIVAGGRRLQAIGELLQEGALPMDFSIIVMLVTENEAIEISLTENLGREDMHPADVYVAMQAMIEHGRAIEDVALRFELEVPTVKRYLKLANIAPRFIDMFRDGELNFDHMMAFALVDSHADQEQAWDSLSEYNRYPRDLRNLLTAQKINTATDRLARFVGVETFEKAGGVVTRDLFAEDGTGYIADAALLEKLAVEKLGKHAKKLAKEGAAWVDIIPRADYAELSVFGKVRVELAALSDGDQQLVDALAEQIESLDTRIDDAQENEDDELWELLDAERDEKMKQRAAILASRATISNTEDIALAGAVVFVNSRGELSVLENAIRPADVAKRATVADESGFAPGKRQKADHSDRLTAELTSQRTAALQAEIMDQSDVALVYLTYTLIQKTFVGNFGYSNGSLAKVSLSQPNLTDAAGQSPAAQALAQRREQLKARLPEDSGENLLDWLRKQPQPVVLEILAFCVATSIDATLAREQASPEFSLLGKALDLDMNKWWFASADAYFDHVPKDRMMKIVSEAVSAEAAVPLEKMKKKQAADAAERALNEARWLPELLRTA
jgi:ParB family chromosome partitioning protein